MSKILFIQAGGTIDKDYKGSNVNHGYNFAIGEPAIARILKRARFPHTYRLLPVCKKDSLDMTDDDRNAIRSAAADAKEDMIVILHGTDTIHVTAKHVALLPKTIVLTGAMQPERFRDSDADFNAGMAIGAAQCAAVGTYIALYGEVRRWDEFIPR